MTRHTSFPHPYPILGIHHFIDLRITPCLEKAVLQAV